MKELASHGATFIPVERLLYTRAQTGQALGDISVAQVKRLERQGLLTPKRLSRSPTGQVFHTVEQVRALAASRTVDDQESEPMRDVGARGVDR
jgi:hypothetical protein